MRVAQKNLTGSSWKAFAKGKAYKEAGLLKALDAFEKIENGSPAAHLDALDEIGKQAELLRKLHKTDKDLLAWLVGIDKSVALERKAVATAAPAPNAKAGNAGAPPSPALLTTTLLSLLRRVGQGEVMQAAIALAAKDAAVLLSPRDMGPAGRKLLTDYLGADAGVKFIAAQCLFEAKAHTFVVPTPGGLAKRLQAALLKQTGARLKLRVRGDDPNDVDQDDGEEAVTPAIGKPVGAASASSAIKPQAIPAKTAAQTPAQAAASKVQPASAQAQAVYEARLARLLARLQQATRIAPADAAKAKALVAFAQGKAREQNHAAALLGLDQAEKMLDVALQASASTPLKAGDPASADKPEAPKPPPDQKTQPAAKTPPFDEAAFRRRWATVKGGWRDALDTVDGQVATLQTALRKLGDTELTQIADKGLNGITGNFKTPVMVAVMEVDNARGEAALKKAAQKGVRAAKAFAAYLASEATVRVTDENPFGVPMTIRASLGQALKDIEAVLGPLA